MGGHPYWYFVPYQKDVQDALDDLRDREFAAGRYNPVIDFPTFSEAELLLQNPGAQHASIDEAIDEAAEDGTRSILDICLVGARPDYGTAAPLAKKRLLELYATEQPTRDQVAKNMDFLEEIDRGHCAYVVIYADGKPSEICFAGYSYD